MRIPVMLGILAAAFSLPLGVGVGLFVGAHSMSNAGAETVAIIKNERPGMGPFELSMWSQLIIATARKHGLDPRVLAGKIAQESKFDNGAVSDKGARCASQIMPVNYRSPADVRDLDGCVNLGALLLAGFLKDADGRVDVALQYYYAGPRNVKAAPPGYYHAYSDAILARVYIAEQTANGR